MHRQPLLLAVTLQTVLACLLWLGATPAAACSPPASARLFYTLGESLPADGATDVPLDAAVLLPSRTWTDPSALDYPAPFDSLLTVTVRDEETGATVPGGLKGWGGQTVGAVWRPERPLSPNRRYTLQATLSQRAPRPSNAEGPTELRLSFSTGSRLTAPLELLGGLEVRLERREVPRYDCPSDGCGCEEDGTERASHARVQVPAIQGGALGTYEVQLWVTDRTPRRFDGSDPNAGHAVSWGVWNVGSSGAATETLFQMPRHDDAYRPCFAWQVLDPAGRTLEGPPVCLDEEVEPPGGFLGCSVGPGSSRGAVAVLLLAGLAVTLRWRRRVP